ncbi:uncharacterized protein B0H18DRAFT_1121340 [Fomitopsis serialis]|uniref:uncharacterized protein n=1 Tax=Fomitopsis serialis TaxID=139415 RepID=UPI0020077414|nr:uncharacterized protein B0H18DRAFT_1121340 [Neoantrodia serialis]KAH9921649.1 hypothetical protein B0H18DRAFT_1121340 [Neoantrodia serialis]
MQGWTAIDRLHKVRVSTLVINGRMDMAQDFVVAPFFEKINKVKWITFEKSSHCPFWEERERYMNILDEFLKLLEGGDEPEKVGLLSIFDFAHSIGQIIGRIGNL